MRAVRDQAIAVATAIAVHSTILIVAWIWASGARRHLVPFHVEIPTVAGSSSLSSGGAALEPAPTVAVVLPGPPAPPRPSTKPGHSILPARAAVHVDPIPVAHATPSVESIESALATLPDATGAGSGLIGAATAFDGPGGLGAMGGTTAPVPPEMTYGDPRPSSPGSSPTVDPDALQRAIQAAIRYPRIARQQGVEGRVMVRFRVDAAGQPADLSIAQSGGDLLDEAALDAVRRAAPFHSGPGSVRVPVDFSLRGAP